MFEGKTVVITGAAHGIGKCTAEKFRELGANVAVFDIQDNPYFKGDLSDRNDLDRFVQKVIDDFGSVDVLVNNAIPMKKGLKDCSYDEFMNALQVGVAAPFYLAQQFAPHFNEGASIINISSTRDSMSQANSESYAAAKGGIHALTHALAASLAHKVRVNSISPGWIETDGQEWDGADALQQSTGRVGKPEDIADMILFLASDHAGFINGENIRIDGGMTRQMIYHGEEGWTFDPSEQE